MNKERLLKLADHLEFGKLGHEKFNFKNITTVQEIGNFCNTVACGIGECPIAFPDEWEFKQLKTNFAEMVTVGIKKITDITHDTPFHSARLFFDMSEDEVNILFIPISDLDESEETIINYEADDGGAIQIEAYIIINNEKFYALNWLATKEDLAKNIRKFVELKEKHVI
jgi:hypothetical protein